MLFTFIGFVERMYLCNKTPWDISIFLLIATLFIMENVLKSQAYTALKEKNDKLTEERRAVCDKSFEQDFDLSGIVNSELEK